jgi:hypothetical protein
MKSGGIFKTQNGETRGAESTPLELVLAACLMVGLVIPTPTLAGVNKKVMDVCHQSTDAAFRAKYCSAAKDLKHGYNANIATTAVWTGVSLACGAACGKVPGVSGTACKIASTGGSAGEGIITKKFTDALAGEGLKWAGDAKSGAEDAPKSGGVNGDACTVAGESALKAYGKLSESKQNDKSLTQLRDQTKDMNTPAAQNQVAFTGDTQTSGDTNGANQSAASAGKTDPCNDAAIATALGAVRCAAGADPSLPPYVKSEEFMKDLQKATGKSPDAFFSGFESPAKSIFDSPLVSGLPDSQQTALADSLSAMEGYSDRKAAKTAANSPSIGGYSDTLPTHSADDDTGFDMNGMLANVLGQLNGAGDDANGAAAHAGGHLSAGRSPASRNVHAAEDRKISIFDRVQWRYGAVSARDRLGVK